MTHTMRQGRWLLEEKNKSQPSGTTVKNFRKKEFRLNCSD